MRFLSLIFFAAAFLTIQALIGGTRIVFSAPAYALLALAGLALAGARAGLALPRKTCLALAIGLAVWIAGRALFSPVAYLARNDLLSILAALLAYLAVATRYTDARTRLTLLGVLLFAALAHAAVGAVQFKESDNFMLLPGILRPSYGWRASGFYICPNHLAGLLEMLGLAGLGVAIWSKGRPWLRVVAGYVALMCLAGIALTGSRGGYLSIIFGLGIFALLSLWVAHRMRRGGFWLMAGGVLAGGVLILGGVLLVMMRSDTLQARLGQVYEPGNMRLQMWQAALQQFDLQPLIGTGSGTYLFYGRQYRAVTVQNDPMHVHNDYLELLAEYGIIGAVLAGGFLLVHLIGGLAGVRRIVDEQLLPGAPPASNELALVIGALSAIAALLLHSIVDFNLHIPANALVAAFLFAILAQPLAPAVAPRAGWLRWATAALALALLALCVRFFPGEFFAEKARVALRDDRNADALALAERGLAFEKKNPALYQHLGDAKHFLTLQAPDFAGRRALHEEAVAAYEEGLQLFPRDTGLLLKLAQAFILLERFPEAEDAFRRVFECDPNFSLAYAYYGLHWQSQRRLKMAEHYFRKAKKLGEYDISDPALKRIEEMKKSPAGQALMSLFPEPELELEQSAENPVLNK